MIDQDDGDNHAERVELRAATCPPQILDVNQEKTLA